MKPLNKTANTGLKPTPVSQRPVQGKLNSGSQLQYHRRRGDGETGRREDGKTGRNQTTPSIAQYPTLHLEPSCRLRMRYDSRTYHVDSSALFPARFCGSDAGRVGSRKGEIDEPSTA